MTMIFVDMFEEVLWRCHRETKRLRKSSGLIPCLSMPSCMVTKPRPLAAAQDSIASMASSIRTEDRKLKADATAALDTAKRKIENSLVNY